MALVTRLVTFVDVYDDDNVSAGRMSVSARHEAVLEDGRHIVLLDDRGWTAEMRGSNSDGPPDIWALTSVQEVVDTARTVVGPDEPPAGRSFEEEAAGHWRHLAAVLHHHGVPVDSRALQQLPHDVVLSDELLARIRE